MSNLINKAKDALSGHGHKSGNNTNDPQYDNPESTKTEGPHKSDMLNKMDPRVDSDRDGRNDPSSRVGGMGNTQTGYGADTTGYGTTGTTGTTDYGTTGTTGTTGGAGYGADNTGLGSTGATGAGYGTGTNTGYDDPRSTNAGPHGSGLANKLDPRVDSDRDGRNDPSSRVGGYGNTQDTYGSSNTGAGYGSSGVVGGGAGYGTSGTTGGVGSYDDPRSSNLGPHSSNAANKLDPRVDSDGDRTGGLGGQSQYGSTTGGYGSNTGAGYDSTTGTTGYGSTGSGRSDNAGPHNSNLLNKLDPRVDSDQDGSRTTGGNQTYN